MKVYKSIILFCFFFSNLQSFAVERRDDNGDVELAAHKADLTDGQENDEEKNAGDTENQLRDAQNRLHRAIKELENSKAEDTKVKPWQNYSKAGFTLLRLAARGGTIAMDVLILNLLEDARMDTDTFGGEVALDAAYAFSIIDIVSQSLGICGDFCSVVNSEATKCSMAMDVISIKLSLLGQWLPIYLAGKHLKHKSTMDDISYSDHQNDLSDALTLAELSFIPKALGIIPSCFLATLPNSIAE